MTFNTWSTTAASNNDADSTINWREGQAPSTVNNSARAMMAALAKYRNDMRGTVLTGGSSTAYTATSNEGYNTAYADGDQITVQFHTTSGAAPTLNLDGLGSKAIRTATATAIGTGRLIGGSIHRLTYNLADDCFYLHGFVPDITIIPAATVALFFQAAAPTNWTQVTSQNNKALRVVSGTGGGTGGSVAFTTAFASQTPSGTVGGHALTVNEMPLHGHPFRTAVDASGDSSGGLMMAIGGEANQAAYTGALSNTPGQQISGTGGGATHTHSFTGNAINLAVQYADIILCSKDAYA